MYSRGLTVPSLLYAWEMLGAIPIVCTLFFYFFLLLFIIYFIFYLLFSLVYLERKTTEPSRSLSAIAEFLVEVEYLKNGVF